MPGDYFYDFGKMSKHRFFSRLETNRDSLTQRNGEVVLRRSGNPVRPNLRLARSRAEVIHPRLGQAGGEETTS